MPFNIVTATASFRLNSEDRVAVHRIQGGVVVAVADGAGGMPGGGPAAELATRIVKEALARPGFNPFTASSWADLLVEADAYIERDRVAGEATCVIVGVGDRGVVGASCGDSGAIIVGADGTIDDLTEKQRRKLRLGSGRAGPVAFQRPVLNGTLLVATDGLLAYARPDVIVRIVAEHEDLDVVAEGLVKAVRLPTDSYVDDVAVVLARRA